MVEKERQQSWSEYFDQGKKNKLFVRFVFTSDFKEVEEFAVVYLIILEEKEEEVIRYDCSEREATNVHKFFHKKAQKRYLNREKSFDTLKEFIEDIRKNWVIYRSKFFEK